MRHSKLFAALSGFSGLALLCTASYLQASSEHRLSKDKSLFVRRGASQPVDWYRLGPEAVQTAKQQNKPILLEVGASWCPFCQAMDRESFSNPEMAKFINEHFIAIRVDYDEDPELTRKLQQAQHSAKFEVDLPLLMVLKPGGELFEGGCYFPPVTAKHKPSFSEFLHQSADAFAHKNFPVAPQNIASILESVTGTSIR